MTKITFKQQFTFNEEAVMGFAIHLGWQDKVTRQIEVVDDATTTPVTTHFATEEYNNPQTFTEYVEEKAREHTLLFTKSWGERIKKQYLNAQVDEFRSTIEPSLNAQILKPIEDALISEIIVE